ncbi:hypothetical protein GPALN_010873 [Globodera pallida]|nr:hypothetical protein GPALN_010873 [Globodera pallida]
MLPTLQEQHTPTTSTTTKTWRHVVVTVLPGRKCTAWQSRRALVGCAGGPGNSARALGHACGIPMQEVQVCQHVACGTKGSSTVEHGLLNEEASVNKLATLWRSLN